MCASYGLLGATLYRAGRERLLREYPVFYAYISYVLLSSLVVLRLSFISREVYFCSYWIAEFSAAFLGTGVVWETYGAVLAGYPGVRRMARALIGSLVLAITVKLAVDLATHPIGVLFPTIVEVERDLRSVQAILLLAILVLIFYYRVPLGRNVRYLLFGYSLYIGAVVIALTLQSAIGASFLIWWRGLQPLAYTAALAMWCVGLWRKSANAVPSPVLERDYERISLETARAIARLRTRIAEGLKS
jgi:hypothetical protein